jgi:hypothetical protein
MGGHSSFDALALASNTGSALYADDIGLRKGLSAERSDAPSFSTISLLTALEISGRLDKQNRLEVLLKLVQRNYAFVMPERDLMIQALVHPFNHSDQSKVFSLLAGPMMSASQSAGIAGEVLRSAAIVPIQTFTIEYVARLLLVAMARKWPAPLCGRLVDQAAETTLALLPREYSMVTKICAGFARGEPFNLPNVDSMRQHGS